MFDLNDLVSNLQVEQLDRLLFRGDSLPLPLPRVFGGQVLAQSLNAASRTVDSDRRPHSLHSYFLRPGNAAQPIIFDVDPIRDGGTFNTRRVVAKQDGKAIFNCSISFQTVEDGLDHQMSMPEGVPAPESLEKDIERAERIARENPDKGRPLNLPLSVVDVRSPNPRDYFNPQPEEPVNGFWFKFSDRLDDPVDDNTATHQTLLTYISDYGLMGTGLRPHPVSFSNNKMQAASLDHSLWFHTDFRVDDWLYYHTDSPRAAHARNFNRGSFYTREGVLVASSAQEGLIRMRD